MKQIASTYTYNKTSGVIVLSGSTIDRDQLLLIVNTTRNVTYYNFADSATTLQSYVNPSVYKGFYDGGGMYNIGDIVQTNGNPYGTAGGFFIRLQAPNAGYPPAVGGGSNSHWAPTSASGATITLNASVVSSASSHNNADALTIYYDDQASSGVVNVIGRNVNSTETHQIPVISYDESIDSALHPFAVPIQVTNASGTISQANPLPVDFGKSWEEGLTLKPNIEDYFGQGNGGVGLLAVGGQSYSDPLLIPPIHVVSKATSELPYIKANISITKTAGGSLATNVFMRRIGQYKYQSISGWAGGEDEAYIEIELKASGGNQFYWQAYLFGGLTDFNGNFAYTPPQNKGNSTGDAFPPTTWSPAVGFTGTMTVSYEQPSTQPISGTVTATPAQGTAVTNTNFTSITPSTSLVSAVAGRRVLSVFNEGAGLLYISGGGTCTSASYQVRLGVGEYWECPAGQLALAHTAVFGTTGTARVSQVT